MNATLDPLLEDIKKLTVNVWTSMANVELRPHDTPISTASIGHALAGCVRIKGGWNGAIVLHCAPDLLKKASKAMLSVDPEKATRDDLRDTLGELSNITGGNIKAILPGPSDLSLPIVAEGDELSVRVPKSNPVVRLQFIAPEGPMTLIILETQE